MSEKRNEFKQRIIQHGTFNLKVLTKKLKDWFEENNYYYDEKFSITKKKAYGDEIDVHISGYIFMDDFAKSEILVKFFLYYTDKTGSKGKKEDKGELEIRITADLIYDYKHKFSSKFKSFLLKMYVGYLIRDRFENFYEVKVFNDAQSIFNSLKDELDLST